VTGTLIPPAWVSNRGSNGLTGSFRPGRIDFDIGMGTDSPGYRRFPVIVSHYLHTKLLASSILPVPLYRACLG